MNHVSKKLNNTEQKTFLGMWLKLMYSHDLYFWTEDSWVMYTRHFFLGMSHLSNILHIPKALTATGSVGWMSCVKKVCILFIHLLPSHSVSSLLDKHVQCLDSRKHLIEHNPQNVAFFQPVLTIDVCGGLSVQCFSKCKQKQTAHGIPNRRINV